MTLDMLREIATDSGPDHARFCLEQNATQHGRDALADLFDEMSLIENSHCREVK